jgi:Pentapeptide repeats (9 copies)
VASTPASRVTFSGAHFRGGAVSFRNAEFSGGDVYFDDARFSGSEVSFGGAQFTGGNVDLSSAGEWSFPPVYPWADAPPPGVKLPVQHQQQRA